MYINHDIRKQYYDAQIAYMIWLTGQTEESKHTCDLEDFILDFSYTDEDKGNNDDDALTLKEKAELIWPRSRT